MKNEFVKEYFSIPNIMGYFRIILVFVYMSFFYNSLQGGPYWPVITTIIVSGLTDFFDGKVARKFNMVTDFGKMLDPIADKITIGAIILTMAFKYKMIIYMVALYILKEGYNGSHPNWKRTQNRRSKVVWKGMYICYICNINCTFVIPGHEHKSGLGINYCGYGFNDFYLDKLYCLS